MKIPWSLADIVDLEVCLNLDTERQQHELHVRDRAILAESSLPQNAADHELLSCWLKQRLLQEYPPPSKASPGTMVVKTVQLLAGALCIIGLIGGFGAGQAFFNYSGTNPVNVFQFLLLFVLPQLALLSLVPIIAAWHYFLPVHRPLPVIRAYAATVALLLSRRPGTEQAVYLLRRINQRAGALLGRLLFTVSQLVMAAVNTGLLAATLLKIATTDQAFGWQSTIQLSGPLVHRLASLLATPWSWLVPDAYAFPSLKEIEGSRIILKEGVYHLATEDLVSWWPFLLLALLTYGLLPRLLLVAAGLYAQRREGRRSSLCRPDLQRVCQRMRTPLVQASGKQPPDEPSGFAVVGEPSAAARHTGVNGLLLTLIPQDIAAFGSPSTRRQRLREYGITSTEELIIRLDEPPSAGILQRLADGSEQLAGILVIMEAWLPPITDWLFALGQIQRAAGEATPLFIGLVGRPDGTAGFFPPTTENVGLWRHRLVAPGVPANAIITFDHGFYPAATGQS